jgi:hypothetical protein
MTVFWTSLLGSLVGAGITTMLGAWLGFRYAKKNLLFQDSRAALRSRLEALRRADVILVTDVTQAWDTGNYGPTSRQKYAERRSELHTLALRVVNNEAEADAIDKVYALYEEAMSEDRELGASGDAATAEGYKRVDVAHSALLARIKDLEDSLQS